MKIQVGSPAPSFLGRTREARLSSARRSETAKFDKRAKCAPIHPYFMRLFAKYMLCDYHPAMYIGHILRFFDDVYLSVLGHMRVKSQTADPVPRPRLSTPHPENFLVRYLHR